MKLKELLPKSKQIFREHAPDWLFGFIQMLYWALHPKYPAIRLFPARGHWVAVWKGDRLFIPSPRTAVLAHFLNSYKKVYERNFQVNDGETVLDIGAYVGSFTMTIAKRAKKVLSIEPDPNNYACLQINISKFPNVKTVRKGVWNSKSNLKLYIDPSYPVAHSVVIPPPGNNYVEIEVDTLDHITSELGFNQVDFIKMNIEGAELEALQGAENLLKSVKKFVIDAHHVRDQEDTSARVCQFLEARGFQTSVDNGTVYAWRNQ